MEIERSMGTEIRDEPWISDQGSVGSILRALHGKTVFPPVSESSETGLLFSG